MSMDHEHSRDIFIRPNGDEERQGPWIIESSEHLNGQHSGSICVHDGAEFTIPPGARHSGSLTFRSGSTGRILGKHSGSLHIGPNAVVEVIGDQSGSVHVEYGALLKVAVTGKLAGSLHVSGTIENRGVRGGSVHLASGEIQDIDGGTVKEPVQKNGMDFYGW